MHYIHLQYTYNTIYIPFSFRFVKAKTGASSASTTPEKGTDDALRAATELETEINDRW